MTEMGSSIPSQLPDCMVNSFSILNPVSSTILALRVGKLVIPGRQEILTPHFVATTSRGAVPHLSQDVMRNHTSIGGLYFGLEDFLAIPANVLPPVYKAPRAPHESALRKFAAISDETVTILGPRRVPSVTCPGSNTSTAISILVAHGFTQLEAERYIDLAQQLRPDIVIGFADVEPGKKQGVKRREKMVDRTHAFTRDATRRLYHSDTGQAALQRNLYFAPVLPLDNTQQQLYFADLADELRPDISGLALYDASSLSVIPKELGDLPRLCLDGPKTPQEVLRMVALGADILTIPFIGEVSDAGIALDISFSSADDEGGGRASNPKPLGIDFWSSVHRADLSPLTQDCVCYTCQKHHRAYLHHLLSVKEMLAWTLLQIHNHHTMDLFFHDVRESIADGTFAAKAAAFERRYAPQLPVKTGTGPRLRGYQVPGSGRGAKPQNARAYGRLDDAAEKYAEAQSSIATPDTDAEGLERQGFAEKA